MILSVIIAADLLSVSAMAQAAALLIGVSGEITAFAELAQDIAAQHVPLGTSKMDLELPDTLNATVRAAKNIGETAQTVTGSAIGTPGEPEQADDEPAFTEKELAVPVTWNSVPAYDGDIPGTYIFTPELPEGFVFADDVKLPTITVTADTAEITVTVTDSDVLPDDLRWQNTTAPEFPETVGGTVEGQGC